MRSHNCDEDSKACNGRRALLHRMKPSRLNDSLRRRASAINSRFIGNIFNAKLNNTDRLMRGLPGTINGLLAAIGNCLSTSGWEPVAFRPARSVSLRACVVTLRTAVVVLQCSWRTCRIGQFLQLLPLYRHLQTGDLVCLIIGNCSSNLLRFWELSYVVFLIDFWNNFSGLDLRILG